MNEHIADQRHLALVARIEVLEKTQRDLEQWKLEAMGLLGRLTYRLIEMEERHEHLVEANRLMR